MTEVGSVYGEALYSLAQSEGLSKAILEELTVLNDSFSQEPAYLQLLASPNLSKEERCGILDDSFRGKCHPYVLNFLKILTEKGYTRHFTQCFYAYREHFHVDNGILPVTAVTAVALQPEQAAKLTEKLSSLTGKTVELHNRVDSAVIGGVRLDYNGLRVDGTVEQRLESVRKLLKNTVL